MMGWDEIEAIEGRWKGLGELRGGLSRAMENAESMGMDPKDPCFRAVHDLRKRVICERMAMEPEVAEAKRARKELKAREA